MAVTRLRDKLGDDADAPRHISTVRGVGYRFGRVVANLVSNAFRHGGGEVEITTRSQGQGVVIDVMDRGPGVPSDVAHQVFETFHQARRQQVS